MIAKIAKTTKNMPGDAFAGFEIFVPYVVDSSFLRWPLEAPRVTRPVPEP
jgi:hypothetical protein